MLGHLPTQVRTRIPHYTQAWTRPDPTCPSRTNPQLQSSMCYQSYNMTRRRRRGPVCLRSARLGQLPCTASTPMTHHQFTNPVCLCTVDWEDRL
jgi:hypothetical protein